MKVPYNWKFPIAVTGMCLWMAVVLLAASWLGPYWSLLFGSPGFSVFSGMAVGLAVAGGGACALISWADA